LREGAILWEFDGLEGFFDHFLIVIHIGRSFEIYLHSGETGNDVLNNDADAVVFDLFGFDSELGHKFK